MAAAAILVAGSTYATPVPVVIGPVQVYDFKASVKNSNVARATDRRTNALYDYKFSEMNVLAGYLAVPECTDCSEGRGYATLYIYRVCDNDKWLFRVPATFNLVDVFATRADAGGTTLGNQVEGFLTIGGKGLNGTAGEAVVDGGNLFYTSMAGFFNDAAGSSSPYLDMGNTRFWAAGFGRVSRGKDTEVEIPNPDPCLPPTYETIQGCTTLETLCGQIVGAMEYDFVCAAPYGVLCATLVEGVLTTQNAVASGSWQIRRNVRMEATDMYDAEQHVLAKLPNHTPFNWNPATVDE
jgi:hypothetical protein